VLFYIHPWLKQLAMTISDDIVHEEDENHVDEFDEEEKSDDDD
jgi:hypothetical protein